MTIAAKKCFKCLSIKSLTDFYKHPMMADGRVNKCKECNRKDVMENRARNIDYYIEYDKGRANNPNRVIARTAYAKTKAGKKSHEMAKKKWVEGNAIKRSAQIMVGNAVRDKRLFKPKFCSECKHHKQRIHGHHDDYSKPLSVRWLCAKCHSNWHKANDPTNCYLA